MRLKLFDKIIITLIIILLSPIIYGRANAIENHYVSKAGNDGNTGHSWAQAKLTLSFINSIGAGDSVLFGTGIWYDSHIVPVGGSVSNTTVYACSTATITTAGLATINSGKIVTSWTPYDTTYPERIWQASFVGCTYSFTSGGLPNIIPVVQDDSLFKPEASLANVNAEGKSYYNSTSDIVYVWTFGGVDPNSHTMIASTGDVVRYGGNNDYTMFFGLNLYMGCQGVVKWYDATGSDYNTFSHCKIYYNGWSSASGNGACVYSNHASGYGHYNKLLACDIGYSKDTSPSQTDGCAVQLYQQNYFYIDSCLIHDAQENGVYYKESYTPELNTLSVIRYSHIYNCGRFGVWYYCQSDRDSLYGTIIENCGEAGIEFGEGSATNLGDVFVGNNTIYNCGKTGIAGACFLKLVPKLADGDHNIIYANIFYDEMSASNFVTIDDNDYANSRFDIDYNIWHDPNVGKVFSVSRAVTTWTGWRARGWDVHGDSTEPYLISPTTGDFSVNVNLMTMRIDTTYGGKHWTIPGAWQPGDLTVPVISNITITGIDHQGATINWTTNESGTSKVKYGLTTSYTDSVYSGILVTNHSQILSGLTPSYLYYIKLLTVDGSNNTASHDSSLTTEATPPVVRVKIFNWRTR
jgi:hypothetical protein